jgi:hypothetical protein
MPCSLRETTIDALFMLEFLVKNLLGNMPLAPTNKLFKSLLGLFFRVLWDC